MLWLFDERLLLRWMELPLDGTDVGDGVRSPIFVGKSITDSRVSTVSIDIFATIITRIELRILRVIVLITLPLFLFVREVVLAGSCTNILVILKCAQK